MQTDRSIPELTKDVAFHLGDMFRNELRLARVEATEGVKSLSGGFALVAGGAVVGVSALTVLMMAVAYALGEAMPMWAAAGLVAIIGGIVAWMLVRAGQKALKPRELTLPRTREQVSQDVKNISEQVH